MSVASQWKLKEKEAAAASAATYKTGIPGARGKTEASAKDVSGGEAVSGPTGFKGQVGKSGKPDTTKPWTPQASKPAPTMGISYGKQGVSKLPVGKDTLKTKEADAVQAKDGVVQSVSATPSSKIPVGAKDNIAGVGGRKPFGAGPKKEEAVPPLRSKAEDNKAKTTELRKDPAAGTKDSAAAAPVPVAAAGGDDGPLGPGRTKGLAGFWANQNDEVKTVKKKRLTAVEENLTPMVVENTPQLLEGVVRAQDPGEWKKPLQVEDGWTKNVVSSFQKRQQESYSKRAPISLVEDTSNEKSDATPEAEAATVKVKDISQRLTRQQSEPTKQAKEKLVIDRSQGAIVLAENQPMELDPDVVRSDDASNEEVVLEKGRTRNLLQLWKNTEVEYNAPKTSTHRYQGSKPAWILEIEAAKGNSPENYDEGQSEENDTIQMNDESCKRTTHNEERPADAEHANDGKENIVSSNKASYTPPKELPFLKGNKDAETIQSIRPQTEKTDRIKLEKTDVTFNNEIPSAETPTTAALHEKEVSTILPEEMKKNSDTSNDDPLSFPDQRITLQESREAEKDVQRPLSIESEPISQTSGKDVQETELLSQQPAVLPESSNITLDKEEASERVHVGARPLPSPEIQPNEFAYVPRSDIALNLTDAECIGVSINTSENEVALGRNEVAICTAGDVEPFQDIISEGARSIADDTSSRLTDDFVSNLSSNQNTASLLKGLLDQSEKPELAPYRVSDDAVAIQPETNPVREGALMTEDHSESSDNEVFATPTKSVILSPLGSVDIAEQVKPYDTQPRERVENVGKNAKESSFNEDALIDLHTDSIETKREKLSLLSLDELLQIETHPNLDNISSADNTPCLVPALSSPSTPEVNISSERSSGVFDSDSEKCTVWFSPQEESTSPIAKTETISTHDESEHSSGSSKGKTGDGNTTENKVEETNKADASQRSCRVM